MSVRKRPLAVLMKVVFDDLCVCVYVPHPPSQAVHHNIYLSACFTQFSRGV